MQRCSTMIVIVVMVATLACSNSDQVPVAADSSPESSTAEVVRLDTPAAPGAAMPNLFATEDGRVLMSWQEPADPAGGEAASTRGGTFALRFATLDGERWSAPQTIARGDDFFVNWADFPMIIETDGALVAHWLKRNGGRGTAYDIHIARSLDQGASWEPAVVPHHDGTQTEHGFVSLVPEADGGFSAVWLDGRKYAEAIDDAGREMTLRTTRFGADGSQGPVEVLDERICDCCQTSAAFVGETLVVVYRDRSPDEIRDIWSVRRTANGWQSPVPVADDGWQIPGCPVNGPAIVGNGDHGAVAWFALRDGQPEVKLAFTADAGASFNEPILLDTASIDSLESDNPRSVATLGDESTSEHPIPLGRVDVAWVDASRVAVVWMAARGAEADIVLQTVDLSGSVGERQVVATTSAARSSGFPQLIAQGDRLIVAWTEPEAADSLRTAAVTPAR